MDWFQIILPLIGGLGLFLYGMKMMTGGLQRTAGNKMRGWLETLTKNRILAIFAGATITAIIQSSTATTVMTVGFVNAGLMNLSQAVGVIMGANIGTTLTGILMAFKISMVAPIAAFIGIIMLMFAKDKKIRNIGHIVAGIGILFMGMNMMSEAMKPLSSSEEFMGLIGQAKIPIVGLLVGTVLTAILQSSTAMTGVLIALALAGVLDLQTGVFIIFGANIGTCVTAMLASLGGTKSAKRTAIIHLLFNVIGAVVFTAIVMLPIGFISLLEQHIKGGPAVQLAGLHIIFSVATTILLLPIAKQLVWISKLIIKGEDKEREDLRLLYIESKSFNMTELAVSQARKEVERMANIALKNYRLSIDAFLNKREDVIEDVLINEEVVNFLDYEIARHLVKISVLDLEYADREMISSLYQVVSSIERISDYAENISEFSQALISEDRIFSEEAISEIKSVANNVEKVLTRAVELFAVGDYNESVIDDIQHAEREMYAEVMQYKENHLKRSEESISERKVGLIFTNMLENLRGIVHHSGGLARSVRYLTE